MKERGIDCIVLIGPGIDSDLFLEFKNSIVAIANATGIAARDLIYIIHDRKIPEPTELINGIRDLIDVEHRPIEFKEKVTHTTHLYHAIRARKTNYTRRPPKRTRTYTRM